MTVLPTAACVRMAAKLAMNTAMAAAAIAMVMRRDENIERIATSMTIVIGAR